jgi:hypothetical protein
MEEGPSSNRGKPEYEVRFSLNPRLDWFKGRGLGTKKPAGNVDVKKFAGWVLTMSLPGQGPNAGVIASSLNIKYIMPKRCLAGRFPGEQPRFPAPYW